MEDKDETRKPEDEETAQIVRGIVVVSKQKKSKVQGYREYSESLPPLSDEDKRIVDRYIGSLPPKSDITLKKYKEKLPRICREIQKIFGKSVPELSKDELKEYVKWVNNSSRLTNNTKWDYRKFIKPFFAKIRGKKFVDWLTVGRPETTVEAKDLITPAEMAAMREVCKNPRDRALIETLYELGCTPEELLALNLDSVQFDDTSALVSIPRGKHKARNVRAFNAAPLLANWIEGHPRRHEKNAPLWTDQSPNSSGDGLGEQGLRHLVKSLAYRANIRRRIYPYLFRHTANTNLIRAGVNEPTLGKYAGWTERSKMSSVYVHLVESDLDNTLRKVHGLPSNEGQLSEAIRTPRKCPRCLILCASEQEICNRCGFPLTVQAQLKTGERQRNHQEVLSILTQNLPFLKDFFQYASILTVQQAKESRERVKSLVRDMEAESEALYQQELQSIKSRISRNRLATT